MLELFIEKLTKGIEPLSPTGFATSVSLFREC